VSAADQAIAYALAQVGKPYQWGGTGPNSFDCSGLTQQSYKAGGISIPRTALLQSHSGTAVGGMNQVLPGDLIFPFVDESHVCMFLGNNNIVEAPQTGEDVHVIPYYASAGGIRRYDPSGGTAITGGIAGSNVGGSVTGNNVLGLSTSATGVLQQLSNIGNSLDSPKDWASFAFLAVGAMLLLFAGIEMLGDSL
jgi:hypothetical protein